MNCSGGINKEQPVTHSRAPVLKIVAFGNVGNEKFSCCDNLQGEIVCDFEGTKYVWCFQVTQPERFGSSVVLSLTDNESFRQTQAPLVVQDPLEDQLDTIVYQCGESGLRSEAQQESCSESTLNNICSWHDSILRAESMRCFSL